MARPKNNAKPLCNGQWRYQAPRDSALPFLTLQFLLLTCIGTSRYTPCFFGPLCLSHSSSLLEPPAILTGWEVLSHLLRHLALCEAFDEHGPSHLPSSMANDAVLFPVPSRESRDYTSHTCPEPSASCASSLPGVRPWRALSLFDPRINRMLFSEVRTHKTWLPRMRRLYLRSSRDSEGKGRREVGAGREGGESGRRRRGGRAREEHAAKCSRV